MDFIKIITFSSRCFLHTWKKKVKYLICACRGTPPSPLPKTPKPKTKSQTKITVPLKNLSEFFFFYGLENLSSLLAVLVTVTIKAVQKSKLLFSDAEGRPRNTQSDVSRHKSFESILESLQASQWFRCQTRLNPNLRSFTFTESCWLRKS